MFMEIEESTDLIYVAGAFFMISRKVELGVIYQLLEGYYHGDNSFISDDDWNVFHLL